MKLFATLLFVPLLGLSQITEKEKPEVPKLIAKADFLFPGLNVETKIFENTTFNTHVYVLPKTYFYVNNVFGFHVMMDFDIRRYFSLQNKVKISPDHRFFFALKCISNIYSYSRYINNSQLDNSKGFKLPKLMAGPFIGFQKMVTTRLNGGLQAGLLFNHDSFFASPFFMEIHIGYAFIRR